MTTADEPYFFEEYVATIDTLADTLAQHGVAILPSLLNDTEQENIRSGVWDFLEHITQTWQVPLNRNLRATWKSFFDLLPLHGMMIQNYHVGHAQVSWDVRQNPKVVDVFAHLWQCSREELVVSWDGFSFSIPPEQTNRGWQHKRKGSNFHSDQSYARPDFECIQSWVTANDVEEGDATLAFYTGSHVFHREFAETVLGGNVSEKDWFRHTEEQLAFYQQRGCQPRRIKCPRGSLVLWDSRLVHCGGLPIEGRSNPKFRFVLYVCYLPQSHYVKRKQRKEAFAKLKTTSHNGATNFPDKPRFGSELDITMIDPPVLNEIGQALLGFNL